MSSQLKTAASTLEQDSMFWAEIRLKILKLDFLQRMRAPCSNYGNFTYSWPLHWLLLRDWIPLRWKLLLPLWSKSHCPNVSATPLRQWGFWQCLPFSWTTLRGKHCRYPIAVMGVVDMFGLCHKLREDKRTFIWGEKCWRPLIWLLKSVWMSPHLKTAAPTLEQKSMFWAFIWGEKCCGIFLTNLIVNYELKCMNAPLAENCCFHFGARVYVLSWERTKRARPTTTMCSCSKLRISLATGLPTTIFKLGSVQL